MKEKFEVKHPSPHKQILTIILIVITLYWSIWFAGFDTGIGEFISNMFVQIPKKFNQIFLPIFTNSEVQSYFFVVLSDFGDTIQMAIIGTFLGALIAFPTALLAARNFFRNKPLNTTTRVLLNLLRTLPALFYAKLLVKTFGLGTLPGAIALMIFSYGLISKLTYETVETIDEGQVEALLSVGGTKMEVLRYAFLPQILPQFISYVLYSFEINVRAALILGYVGAGGIGEKLQRNLDYTYIIYHDGYGKVGLIIVMTFIIVFGIDMISTTLRRKLV